MASGEVHSFEKLTDHSGLTGNLRLNATGLGFKASNGNTTSVGRSDLKLAQWIPTGKQASLRLVLEGGGTMKYSGFKAAQFDELSRVLSSFYNLALAPVEVALEGWNWGEVGFSDRHMDFRVNDKLAFEVPFADLSQAFLPAKGELLIELHVDDVDRDAGDVVQQIRLAFPTEEMAQDAQSSLLSRADLASAAGNALAKFERLLLKTPRGRYDVEFFSTFLLLHGSTFDFKVLYKNITRLTELPMPDGKHICYVIGVDKPLRQGSTAHPFVVLQFDKEDLLDLELQIDAETLQTKYASAALAPSMTGLAYKLFRKVSRGLTGQRVSTVGEYRSSLATHAVFCSLKASDGCLFPLERGLFFVYKPAVYLRYKDMTSVEFHRVTPSGLSSRSFDIECVLSTAPTTPYLFQNINIAEYTGLYDYLHAQGVRVKGGKVAVGVDMRRDDEGGKRQRRAAAMAAGGGDEGEGDEEEESEDEEFVPDDVDVDGDGDVDVGAADVDITDDGKK